MTTKNSNSKNKDESNTTSKNNVCDVDKNTNQDTEKSVDNTCDYVSGDSSRSSSSHTFHENSTGQR